MKIQTSGNYKIWQRAEQISRKEGIDLTSAFYRANDAIRREESNADVDNQRATAIPGTVLPNPSSKPSWPTLLTGPLLEPHEDGENYDLAAYLSLHANFASKITKSDVQECKEKGKHGACPRAFTSFEAPVPFVSKLIAIVPVATLLILLAWCISWVGRHTLPDAILGWMLVVSPWFFGVLAVVTTIALITLFFEGTTPFAYGYRDLDRVVLAFRGTKMKRISDWLTDGNILPWGCPCRHLGFLFAWGSIQDQVTSWIESLDPKPASLILTGHSLGGALAKIAAFDLASKYPINAVVTFGAPRIGFPRFRDAYEILAANPAPDNPGGKTLGGITHRYTHHTDLVSRLPPPVPYFHVGTPYYIEDTGDIETDPPPSHLASIESYFASLEADFNNQTGARYCSVAPPMTVQRIGDAGTHVANPVILPPMYSIPGIAKQTRQDDSTVTVILRLWERFSTIRCYAVAYFPVHLAVALVSLAVVVFTAKDVFQHPIQKYVNAFGKRYDGEPPDNLLELLWGRRDLSLWARIRRSADHA